MPAVDLCPSCGWPLVAVWSERFQAYGISCLHITVYAETPELARAAWQKGYDELIEERANEREDQSRIDRRSPESD
jgi:hypothetical protein